MLKISGGSDDIVMANIELVRACSKCGSEIEEPTESVVGDKEDEISCYDQSVIFTIGWEGEAGGVVVEMIYTGVWAAKIHQLGEDTQIPWAVSVESEGYTVIVKVACPNGTPVKIMKRANP